jgi:hypothetical protein
MTAVELEGFTWLSANNEEVDIIQLQNILEMEKRPTEIFTPSGAH